jgi:dTDP-4-amino-4,6-dideoxygalactose transaminase
MGDFPLAEAATQQCINLPIFPTISDNQIERVSDVIHDFFK